jgi:hypothetical protein
MSKNKEILLYQGLLKTLPFIQAPLCTHTPQSLA